MSKEQINPYYEFYSFLESVRTPENAEEVDDAIGDYVGALVEVNLKRALKGGMDNLMKGANDYIGKALKKITAKKSPKIPDEMVTKGKGVPKVNKKPQKPAKVDGDDMPKKDTLWEKLKFRAKKSLKRGVKAVGALTILQGMSWGDNNIVSLLPNDLNIVSNGQMVTIPKSAHPVHFPDAVESANPLETESLSVDVYAVDRDDAAQLPPPEDNIIFVVMPEVANRVPLRTDFLIPNTEGEGVKWEGDKLVQVSSLIALTD
jgi:hypothetical protein